MNIDTKKNDCFKMPVIMIFGYTQFRTLLYFKKLFTDQYNTSVFFI